MTEHHYSTVLGHYIETMKHYSLVLDIESVRDIFDDCQTTIQSMKRDRRLNQDASDTREVIRRLEHVQASARELFISGNGNSF